MAEHTSWNRDEVDIHGRALLTAFADAGGAEVVPALRDWWGDAGRFLAGKVSERVVDDRRNAFVMHMQRLHLSTQSLGRTIQDIVDAFDDADSANAQQITRILNEDENAKFREMSQWATDLEKKQANYHDPGESGRNGDGDGYDDDLSQPEPDPGVRGPLGDNTRYTPHGHDD